MKQLIKCDVHSCEHCDCGCDECNLKKIKVCNKDDVAKCDSYEKKDEE